MPLRGAEEPLEKRLFELRGLGQEGEDATAAVVDDDEHGGQSRLPPAPDEGRRVVQESQVARAARRRGRRCPRPRRRHRESSRRHRRCRSPPGWRAPGAGRSGRRRTTPGLARASRTTPRRSSPAATRRTARAATPGSVASRCRPSTLAIAPWALSSACAQALDQLEGPPRRNDLIVGRNPQQQGLHTWSGIADITMSASRPGSRQAQFGSTSTWTAPAAAHDASQPAERPWTPRARRGAGRSRARALRKALHAKQCIGGGDRRGPGLAGDPGSRTGIGEHRPAQAPRRVGGPPRGDPRRRRRR